MNVKQKKFVGSFLGAGIAMLLIAPALLGFSHPAHADTPTVSSSDTNQYFGALGAGKTGTDFAASAGLGGGDLVGGIGKVIQTAMGFLGIIAVVIILLGGFKWMTAGGNDEKVKGAKKLIFQGIIGLVIVLAAYSIAQFVILQIAGVTNAPGA